MVEFSPTLVFVLFGVLSLCQPVKRADNGTWPTQSFRTAPAFRPPVFDISKSGAALAPGLLMMSFIPAVDNVESAAVIMTDDGDLVWNSSPGSLSNLRVQRLDSAPVLTYWNGSSVGEKGYGAVSILDSTYTEIYQVCPQIYARTPDDSLFDCYGDIHESYITDRGTMLMTVYNITTADLTSVNGPKDGWIYDNLFYEVDIKTNEILFRWSSYDAGIPLTASRAPLGEASEGNGTREDPFDYFHINSVQRVGSYYFMNGRNYWTSYLIDGNGDIVWTIEGDTGGNFTIPEDGHFAWQHHAVLRNFTDSGAILTYFDNDNGNPPLFNGTKPARGLEFNLDFENKTATLLKNLIDPNELTYPIAAGSYQSLPNGNAILGYGTYPSLKEFGPDGDVRMSIRFGDIDTSSPAGFTSLTYRVWRDQWVGTPAWSPTLVFDQDNQSLYMSWNGATGITTWEISCGNTTEQQSARSLGMIPSTGFETMFNLTSSECRSSVQATAYRAGTPLRSTNSVLLTGRI
ncbi:MAG: hypothetical protein M1820_000897 [Bogoriella megaspora]|nr:MAG: hypothetical protein M1820_000897 [Bogoriella megaspora]